MNSVEISEFSAEKADWDNYVLKHLGSSWYHLIAWKNVVENSFGHKGIYLMAHEDKKICGILPLFFINSRLFGKFFVSLPFANYGGICADSESVAASLISRAKELTSKYKGKYLELRHITPLAEGGLYNKLHKETFLLKLNADSSYLWRNFSDKLRNRIRKAEKYGLIVKIGGRELLDDFYDAYAQRMKELGSPVYGFNFFQNVLVEFPEKAKAVMVYYRDKEIGAAIFVSFRKTIDVPWEVSSARYFNLCPNSYLYWKVISYACENNYEYLDFGTSNIDSSHSFFKARWGAKPIQLHWQYYLNTVDKLPQLSPSNPMFHLPIQLWKKMPLSLTRLIGPKIARYLP